MSALWRYVRVQLLVLLCGIVGPIFLVIYFVAADPMLEWMLWTGLLVTAIDVLIALAITAYGSRSAARTRELEASGVLALAQVTGMHETATRINNRPLIKLDLQVAGPGIAPFSTQDRVIASVSRLPMITSRKLVVLVDQATNGYQIDWERSAFVSGMMPSTFSVAQEGLNGQTYDLTGQTEPLMEILQVLRTHNISLDNIVDLRANLVARQQVQAIVRHAAAQQAPPPASVPYLAPAEPTTAQRLQELETLRATGSITDAEYTAKRQEIIADI